MGFYIENTTDRLLNPVVVGEGGMAENLRVLPGCTKLDQFVPPEYESALAKALESHEGNRAVFFSTGMLKVVRGEPPKIEKVEAGKSAELSLKASLLKPLGGKSKD